MSGRLAGAGLAAAVLLTLVSGCGGGEGEPPQRPAASGSFTPSRTLPTPTRTPRPTTEPTDQPIEQPSTDTPEPEATPTASLQPPEETTAPPTAEPTEPPTTTATPDETQNPETQTPTTEPAESEDSGDDEMPPWLWWLLGALVIGLGALIWLLVARGRRRRAGQEQLHDAEADVAWLARDLLPQLRSTGSRDQAFGGWQVARPQVDAVVDRLTVLASSAGDAATAARAGHLRDAVRSAQERMEHLDVEDRRDTWVLDVDDAIARLEWALAPPQNRPGPTG